MAIGPYGELRDNVARLAGGAKVGQGARCDHPALFLDDEDLVPHHVLTLILRRHLGAKLGEHFGGVELGQDAVVVALHQVENGVDIALGHPADQHLGSVERVAPEQTPSACRSILPDGVLLEALVSPRSR